MTVTLLDETNRPKAPPIPGATAEHRARGRHLAAIHRMHLQHMADVRRTMAAVARGLAAPSELGAAVGAMQMMQNYRAFGGMCGQQCQFLTGHHTIEDTSMFPPLRAAGGEGLRKVVDKLAAEHLVVHALLDELGDDAEKLVATPCEPAFRKLADTFERLEAVVRSHFGYEESELEEALGFYGLV